jgi:hypothetical protein
MTLLDGLQERSRTVLNWLRDRLRTLRYILMRGADHRRQLSDLDVRIGVIGSRGKSTTVRWLHEALVERGIDTYSKITGERPQSLYGGEIHPVEREGRTMLYENEREIRTYDPDDAIVIENQGIREYTTRLINARYVDSQVVVLTNVRRDHLDTFGQDYREIARAMARAVPAGAHVVSGERNETIHDYLKRELARRNATITQAIPSDDEPVTPGRELVTLVDAVLAAIDEDPLRPAERRAYLAELAVEWTWLPEGRVYYAANVNDVDSTEMIRRALQDGAVEEIQPLVYFRRDRPGRTATFIEYLNWLADRGLITSVHVTGANPAAVERGLTIPVVTHDEASERPEDVLDAALAEDLPVVVMGNAVPEFMRDLEAEIERRASLSGEAVTETNGGHTEAE